MTYVCVIMLSDLDGMEGGELQFIKRRRPVAKALLEEQTLTSADIGIVSYKKKGHCIPVQGSELCHRVTKVTHAKEDRMSFVVSFVPANVYRKDRVVYQV